MFNNFNNLVYQENQEVYTTSLKIAEVFQKNHFHVMRDIKNLIEDLKEIGEFNATNFGFISYKDSRNRKQEMYAIDRDGFSQLVMVFTGKKALKFRSKFIKAFNNMEEYIKQIQNKQSNTWVESREQGKLIRKELTDIIEDFIVYAVEQGSKNAQYYYIHITAYINKILYGIDSLKKIDKNLRDLLDKRQLTILATIEIFASKIIQREMGNKIYYKDIYKVFKTEIVKYCDLLEVEKPSLLEDKEYKFVLPEKIKKALEESNGNDVTISEETKEIIKGWVGVNPPTKEKGVKLEDVAKEITSKWDSEEIKESIKDNHGFQSEKEKDITHKLYRRISESDFYNDDFILGVNLKEIENDLYIYLTFEHHECHIKIFIDGAVNIFKREPYQESYILQECIYPIDTNDLSNGELATVTLYKLMELHRDLAN